jgi:hypothetical protein
MEVKMMMTWNEIITLKKPLARQLAKAFRKAQIVPEGWYRLKDDGVHYEALIGTPAKAFDYAYPFIKDTLRQIYDALRQHYSPPIIIFVQLKKSHIHITIDGIDFKFAFK